MSAETYVKLYKETEADLRALLPNDILLSTSAPQIDRASAFKWIAKHYIRYIKLVNNLGMCYDQLTDPLKLGIMRKLLDASVGRLLELKAEMVREEQSDFQYLDQLLIELKITKQDIIIQVPRYYRIDRRDELSKMNENIDKIIYDIEHPVIIEEVVETENQEEEELKKAESIVPERKKKERLASMHEPVVFERKVIISPEKQAFINTILLIQRHERARAARLVAQKGREVRRIQDDIAWHRYEPIPPNIMSKAVKTIQKFWKGYCTRLHLTARDTRLRLLIGEIQSSYLITPQRWEIEKVEEARRRCRKEAAVEWENAIKAADMKLQSPLQQEDIGDELRFFVLSWFRAIGELPMFPDDESMLPPPGILGLPKGCPEDFPRKYCPPVEPIWAEMFLKGSALIAAGFWITPELYELAWTATVIEKKKNAGKKPTPKPTTEQLKQKKLEEKEKALEAKMKLEADIAENRSRGLYVVGSCFMDEFTEKLEDSRLEWRIEEPMSERAGYQIMTNIHLDIRETVDDRIREELIRLQKALDIDRSRKTKPEKPKKKKKKKPKKKGKDMTKDRTLESLFEELVGKGIIKKYPYVNIDDLYGDEALCTSELRAAPFFEDPMPKHRDVRQVIKEYCVLNVMGPRIPPELGRRGMTLAPIRSVLLFGPKGSGKRLLVDAVCTLLGAVKFDLTPANLRGKIDGKKDKKMLVHLVSKVSRLLQPSVIFIHGGEKPFFTKVPKDQKDDNPRLLKKDLPKLMREIKSGDRVIFVATSDAPWMGAKGNMAKMYDKMIPVLNPDYGTRYQFLHSKLMAYHGVDRDFPTSVVARMSKGFSLPVLEEAIKAVLVPRRIIMLKPKPLSPMEIYEYLWTRKEVKTTPEEEKKHVDWFKQTYPLAINRQIKLIADKELQLKMAGNKKKK